MEDTLIIELFFQRNEKAIEETKNKYGKYCFTIANNILKNYEDSEECVSDTYIKTWQSIPPQKPSDFKAWIGRVTRNIAINKWKYNHRKKRHDTPYILMSELDECIPSGFTIDDQIDKNELGRLISIWLRGLTKENQALFIQRYWFGFEIRELSKKFGISSSNLSSRLHYLRSALRKYLEKEDICI